MRFYVVTNGDYVEGYYRKHENALKAMKKVDDLITDFKDNPHVNVKGCWIEIIETID